MGTMITDLGLEKAREEYVISLGLNTYKGQLVFEGVKKGFNL